MEMTYTPPAKMTTEKQQAEYIPQLFTEHPRNKYGAALSQTRTRTSHNSRPRGEHGPAGPGEGLVINSGQKGATEIATCWCK